MRSHQHETKEEKPFITTPSHPEEKSARENLYLQGIQHLRKYKESYKKELLEKASTILLSTTDFFEKLSDEDLENLEWNIRSQKKNDETKKKFITWIRIAADDGYPSAQFLVAKSYQSGLLAEKFIYDEFIAKDYSDREARFWTRKKNQEDHPICNAISLTWLQKAANKGHAKAAYSLGEMYQDGTDIEQDTCIAAKWFHLSAERGYNEAQMTLAKIYEHETEDSIEKPRVVRVRRYRKGTKQHNTHKISDDIEKNEITAAKWYRKAAEQNNNFDAMLELAERSHAGRGLPKNDIAAITWIRKIVEQTNCYSTVGLEYFCDSFKTKFSAEFPAHLSLPDAYVLFHAGIILEILIGKDIDFKESEKVRTSGSHFSVLYHNPLDFVSEISDKITAGFNFLAREYPELFCSLINQEPKEKRQKAIDFLCPEQKSIIMKHLTGTLIPDTEQKAERKTEQVITPAIDIATASQLLLIENFSNSLIKLEEKLYALQEKSSSPEATFCVQLLTKIAPLKLMLTTAMAPADTYATALIKLSELLEREQSLLPSASSSHTLYKKDTSAIAQILDSTLKTIEEFIPALAEKEIASSKSHRISRCLC